MKKMILKQLTVILALFVSESLAAAPAARMDTKKALNVNEGKYVVVSASSNIDEENFCVKGAIHTVKWAGSVDDPMLVLGNIGLYENFNEGLQNSSLPDDKQKCLFRENTLTRDRELINDRFTTCLTENITNHTEVVFGDNDMTYSAEVKHSRGGEVVGVASRCTLKRVIKKH